MPGPTVQLTAAEVLAETLQTTELVVFMAGVERVLQHVPVLERVVVAQFVSLLPETRVNFHLPMWVALQHLLALRCSRLPERMYGLPLLVLLQFPLLQLVVAAGAVNTFVVAVVAVAAVQVLGTGIIFLSRPERVTQLLLGQRGQEVGPTGQPEVRLHSMA